MTTIVTRAGKGSALTWTEGDANFTNLNTAKYEAGDNPTFGLVIATTGFYGKYLSLDPAGTLPVTGVYSPSTNQLNFSTNTTIRGSISSGGNWSMSAPTSGTTLSLTAVSNGTFLSAGDGTGTMSANFSAGNFYFGTTSAHDIYIKVNGVAVGRWDDATGTFFTAPISTNPDLDLTNGQIKFPATQVPSSNVNTLDDYEEGTWTPTDGSGAGLSFSSAAGRYVKIGQLVHVQGELIYPVTASGSSAAISGLPFSTINVQARGGLAIGYKQTATLGTMYFIQNSSSMQLYTETGGAVTNANMSNTQILFSGTYLTTT